MVRFSSEKLGERRFTGDEEFFRFHFGDGACRFTSPKGAIYMVQ